VDAGWEVWRSLSARVGDALLTLLLARVKTLSKALPIRRSGSSVSARATPRFHVYFANQDSLSGSPAQGCYNCTKYETHCSSARACGATFSSTLPDFPRLCSSLFGRRLLSLCCRLVGALACFRRELIKLLLQRRRQLTGRDLVTATHSKRPQTGRSTYKSTSGCC
jgi:hypothetical protein